MAGGLSQPGSTPPGFLERAAKSDGEGCGWKEKRKGDRTALRLSELLLDSSLTMTVARISESSFIIVIAPPITGLTL
jgi:hypothetical protein